MACGPAQPGPPLGLCRPPSLFCAPTPALPPALHRRGSPQLGQGAAPVTGLAPRHHLWSCRDSAVWDGPSTYFSFHVPSLLLLATSHQKDYLTLHFYASPQLSLPPGSPPRAPRCRSAHMWLPQLRVPFTQGSTLALGRGLPGGPRWGWRPGVVGVGPGPGSFQDEPPCEASRLPTGSLLTQVGREVAGVSPWVLRVRAHPAFRQGDKDDLAFSAGTGGGPSNSARSIRSKAPDPGPHPPRTTFDRSKGPSARSALRGRHLNRRCTCVSPGHSELGRRGAGGALGGCVDGGGGKHVLWPVPKGPTFPADRHSPPRGTAEKQPRNVTTQGLRNAWAAGERLLTLQKPVCHIPRGTCPWPRTDVPSAVCSQLRAASGGPRSGLGEESESQSDGRWGSVI